MANFRFHAALHALVDRCRLRMAKRENGRQKNSGRKMDREGFRAGKCRGEWQNHEWQNHGRRKELIDTEQRKRNQAWRTHKSTAETRRAQRTQSNSALSAL